MSTKLDRLHTAWEATNNKATKSTLLTDIVFNELASSLTSIGPFYYYVVDFSDMSLSNVSPSIQMIHGLDPKTVTFNQILETIHGDDLEFVTKAESSIAEFFYNDIGREKLLSYKTNYSFRSRMQDGSYKLLNHQALMLTFDDNGGFGKSLNIHTVVDHLSKFNAKQYSLISLSTEPSYMNIDVMLEDPQVTKFSKREIEIIVLISDGLDNKEIAKNLFISEPTVKKHRSNIMSKTNCTNSPQLIKYCLLNGLI